MFAMDAISPIANRVKRQLEESGQIGSSKRTVLTNAGEETELWDEKVIKVSNEFFDLTKVKELTVKFEFAGEEQVTTWPMSHMKEQFGVTAENYDDGGELWSDIWWSDGTTDHVLATSAQDGPSKGTYLFVDFILPGGNVLYNIISVDFGETITPIDPKYLPGVCLPVVELTTQPTAEGAPLTEAEVNAFRSVGDFPCVVKFTIREFLEPGSIATLASHFAVTNSDGSKEVTYSVLVPGLAAVFFIAVGFDENGECLGSAFLYSENQ